jgi:hypothetical protein
VPCVRSSLDHEHVFILNTKFKIFQFNGSNTDLYERAKALDVVGYLRDKYHKEKCHVATIGMILSVFFILYQSSNDGTIQRVWIKS